ncbi:MAG: hypothetical protein M1832_000660 [Thelocarpon impressellum]|nr:MAG: hypothetical protein M1832_000660 [Thelocarpon impressellum]
MVKPKPKSKRTPVRLRHKIEKAGAAKQRKQRKLAKNNPEWRSRLKKDPGIPNLFPYKDKILHEIEEKKRLKEEDAVRRREAAKAQRGESDGKSKVDDEAMDGSGAEDDALIDPELSDDDMVEGDSENPNPMAALLASARARAAEYRPESAGDEDDDEGVDEGVDEMDEDRDGVRGEGETGGATKITSETIAVAPLPKESSRRAFDKVFKQVVERADVVLYVLDARNPEGTRSQEVERMVMAAEGGQKRLILVLNKIDLIPPPVLKAWLVHLKRYFPTIPLRAAGPAPNAHTFNHRQLTVQGTSQTLLRALKAFAHQKQLKRSISVGVIGYPNVGKSSVINALTARLGGGSSSCTVGAEAGVTTSLKEVKLDGKLKLLDSPGIVFPSTADTSKADEQARLVLLNAVPPKQVEDAVPAVSLLLRRLSEAEGMLAKLLEVYGLRPLVATNGDPTTDFLVQVARRRGRLGKGGVPNISSAATTVITDWRDGRIQGWVEAPTLQLAPPPTLGSDATKSDAASTGVGDQKEIVTEWSKEFHLEGLWGDGRDGGR